MGKLMQSPFEREEANKCLKSLMRVLIIKEGDKYRPAKDTSRQDAYSALYEIQEALGTRRIEREAALLENMQDLELALSALRPVSRDRIEKVWSGCHECSDCKLCIWNETKKCNDCKNRNSFRPLSDFCPRCGKPLTDAAVEMVMERMEVLKNGKSN